MLKKLWNKALLYFSGLTSAGKNIETQVFSNVGSNSSVGGSVISQDVNQVATSVANALLRGELTEEVKELRHRNYKVDREAKKYKYYSPTLALKKKEGKDNKFIQYENEDGLEVITIQDNYPLSEDVLKGIQQIENGGRGEKQKYKVEIERSCTPRFKVEEFLKRIVVKRVEGSHAILDMYFSMYPEQFFNNSEDKSFRSKAFIKEIEKIKVGGKTPDTLWFDTLRFVTKNAYRQDDLMEFLFKTIFFKNVIEYDGFYILRFSAVIEREGIDLTKPFFNSKMEEKYETKADKKVVYDLSGDEQIVKYKCTDCGKVVEFNTKVMGELPISEAREIDEDEREEWGVTEYFDMQIIEQTLGKRLCKSCLRKYIHNKDKETK